MESRAERRRSLRIPLAVHAEFTEKAVMPIQLRDISLAGILLSAPQRLTCGQKGRLNARFDRLSIDSDIEITWVSDRPNAKREWLVGARFVSLDSLTRRAMQDFLENVPR